MREMADFLRSRRDRLRPEAVGLPAYGRRRVPGLRRAEVAQLAGISPDYYMRLEQGHPVRPSPSVLDALARALRLDADERDHLYRLARAEPAPLRRRADEEVVPGVHRLLERLDTVPAYVLNGRLDVLAWNAMAAALVTDFAAMPRRNLVWYAFCDPRARSFYVDWETMARQGVAHLRAATGRDPGDPATRELIEELTGRSEEFRTWWTWQDVKGPGAGRKEFRHPEVGRLTLDYVAMLLPGTLDQQLVTYTAPAGTPSQAALDRLAVLAAGRSEAP
ncbi:helix-turn-helix transcriptional regulator [Actinomadura kijaniata]|uniref:Transcriptional regulator with XRE-family HTH domain n=1 Tax=Actinomadura namibiensis TaxID=182080 RepID=A0A7W3LMK0_ACTNM|nr:helix-turn-helix transcriptional regulator [Actinomadura namibiensis]MBA8950874.1 transcriptional regulator with XRE-family HTH domain [Actinomadura namibiensis]